MCVCVRARARVCACVRACVCMHAMVNTIKSFPIPAPIHCNSFYSVPIQFVSIQFFSIPIKFLSIQFFSNSISISFYSVFFNSNSLYNHPIKIKIAAPIHITKNNHKMIRLMRIRGGGGDTACYCNFLKH